MSAMHPEDPPRTFPCRWEAGLLYIDYEGGEVRLDHESAIRVVHGILDDYLDALDERGIVYREERPAFLASVRRALNIAAG